MKKAFLYCVCSVPLVLAGLMAWGYRYAATHAALEFQVEDSGAKPESPPYSVPAGAVLELFDEAGALLATAQTVSPWGYLSAQQPGLGDCTAQQGRGGTAYSDCFEGYARWIDGWVMSTRFATVRLGACEITRIPVEVTKFAGDWQGWWFPLQHGSGAPLAYVQMRLKFDSRECTRAE
jgi:hypothetical protein